MVFRSTRRGTDALYEKSASGTGEEQLVTDEAGYALSWSPDAQFVLYARTAAAPGSDLWILPMTGNRKPRPLLQIPMEQTGGEFSPDGRWLAYESNDSGRFEVYVQAFPDGGGRRQVSTAGGTQVRWSRDGGELYYVAPDGFLTAVAVKVAADSKSLDIGTPMPLFRTRLATGGGVVPGRPEYAVAPDGRFLMNTIVENTATSPITVVVNWAAMLGESKDGAACGRPLVFHFEYVCGARTPNAGKSDRLRGARALSEPPLPPRPKPIGGQVDDEFPTTDRSRLTAVATQTPRA